MLAYPYGQTQLQSGFKLTGNQNDDATLVPTGTIYTNGVPNFTNWDGQHRWREISNMVEFRNQTQGKWQLDDWTTNGGDRIAFHRGDRGFFAINRDDANAWSATFRTGMAAVRYCNVINGLLNADKTGCGGDIVTVNSDGTASLTIPSMSAAGMPAVAIHTTNVSSTSIALRWNSSTDNAGGSGLKGYNVVRDNGTPIFTTSNTFIDDNRLPATTYKYTVAALGHGSREQLPPVSA